MKAKTRASLLCPPGPAFRARSSPPQLECPGSLSLGLARPSSAEITEVVIRRVSASCLPRSRRKLRRLMREAFSGSSVRTPGGIAVPQISTWIASHSGRLSDEHRACARTPQRITTWYPKLSVTAAMAEGENGCTRIMLEFPHIKKHYWGQHMWARGYFCCNQHRERDLDEIIAQYIANQQDDRDDDFKVDG